MPTSLSAKSMKKALLLGTLVCLLAVFFYFRLYQWLTFDSLKAHRQLLLAWSEQNFTLVVAGFIAVYTLAVACSFPGATFLTLAGGFLFGPVLGTTCVVMGATLGAFIVFMAIDLALRDWVTKKAGKWLQIMESGFNKNAFSYLLVLRFIPLFPFWLVNIVPPLFGVSKRTFLITTLIGIIPGSFVFVTIGSGLGSIFDANQVPNLNVLLDPHILWPLQGLVALSLLPVVYKALKRRAERRSEEQAVV